MLIGEDKWEELNKQGFTLAGLFQDALCENGCKRTFNLKRILLKNVSNCRDVRTLDLIPSSLDMIEIQERLAAVPDGQNLANDPTEVLKHIVQPILDQYDFVLIDCPPNLGLLTLNGLRVSDGYIIPAVPDVLSTHGIPKIVSRVKFFAENISQPIELYGIVVSRYQPNSPLHNRTLKQLQSDREKYPHVFQTVIPQSNAIAGYAELRPLDTLREKHQCGNRYDLFRRLAGEIIAASDGGGNDS